MSLGVRRTRATKGSPAFATPKRKTGMVLSARRTRATKGWPLLAMQKDKTDKHLGNRHKWDMPWT